MWRQSPALKPNVTPPPSDAASPSTLGRERRERSIPQRKNYIINRQNRLNAPGYIARAWAHYNTFRGAPFPREMSQSEGSCTNQSPNHTPMRLGRCHSCTSQRHPDTMHNRFSGEDGLLYKYWPMGVSGYALRAMQCTQYFPEAYEYSF